MKKNNFSIRQLGLAVLAAVMLLVLPGVLAAQTFAPAPAQAPEPAAAGNNSPTVFSGDPLSDLGNKTYRGERITLDFQNADIHNILRLIGEVSGKNVVVSDQVTGKVTLRLKNVPWDQALDIVLASKNLGVVENGNVLRIDTQDAIRRATPDLTDPTTRVRLDKRIFTPKYSSVSTLATELEKVKSIRGTVKVIGNEIYVQDDEATLRTIQDIFNRNDRVTKQILIEARIVEATNNFAQALGVRWGGYGGHNVTPNASNGDSTMSTRHGSNELVGVPGSVEGAPGYPTTGGGGTTGSFYPGEHFGVVDVGGAQAFRLGYGFLNRSGTMLLNAELSAHETLGETKIVSAPRIMASNDQEVYIKQGSQIPYQSSSANQGVNTEFKDAVMELRVTPHIEENGQIISLDITLTKDSPSATGSGGEPAIDKKEAKTKLMVRDGETVVIGGIIEDSQQNDATRVPGLHAIPLLGWLFQDRSVINSKSELLVFITANIIPINV